MKVWNVLSEKVPATSQDVLEILFTNRGLKTNHAQTAFLDPKDPLTLTAKDVSIDQKKLDAALSRIWKAVKNKESIVVYADYDADGVTAGAILWEALHKLGAIVMPYIPHRVDEGYGLSQKGIDFVKSTYDPTLIITVDHGITAKDQVTYAKKQGIDVVVTDHHVKPNDLPGCLTVHTTDLSGAGISFFVAKELLGGEQKEEAQDLAGLSAIGTIADMVPLVGGNRSIAKYGLSVLEKTKRVGVRALFRDAGKTETLSSFDISHVIAPRLNAMGRLEHAMDALRLLCTTNEKRADELSQTLGLKNKERQQLTLDTVIHAKDEVVKKYGKTVTPKILFVTHESYNQGIIGLVAGKLVEEYYLPAVVVARGEEISKASCRSIFGFNIVESIRMCSDLLIDVGGHPMAAGFTVATKNLDALQSRLEQIAQTSLTPQLLIRTLPIDAQLPLDVVTETLWKKIQAFQPFGMGNYEPVFAARNVTVSDVRQIGNGKHLKMSVKRPTYAEASAGRQESGVMVDAVGFGMGAMYASFKSGEPVDIAYTIDMNEWNGRRSVQLKLRDIAFPHEKIPEM